MQTLIGSIGGDPDQPDWAGLAHDAGYCDQSHMIREFREFSGLTPTGYLHRTLPDGGGLLEGFRSTGSLTVYVTLETNLHPESSGAAMRHEIIPNLRYTDAPGAIDFLCEAFGFERRAVYPDARDHSIVQHAQLVWHDRMIMVASHNDSDATRAARIRTIAQAGGATSGPYLIVEDVDAHAERASVAGAEIFLPPGIGPMAAAAIRPTIRKATSGASEATIPGPNSRERRAAPVVV